MMALNMIAVEKAVDAGARKFHELQTGGIPWEELDPIVQHNLREAVLPIVNAACAVYETYQTFGP